MQKQQQKKDKRFLKKLHSHLLWQGTSPFYYETIIYFLLFSSFLSFLSFLSLRSINCSILFDTDNNYDLPPN